MRPVSSLQVVELGAAHLELGAPELRDALPVALRGWVVDGQAREGLLHR